MPTNVRKKCILPGSELCITLPSGEVLDFLMYDSGSGSVVTLPAEVPHDEWAGIHATVRLQLVGESCDDAARKRART